MGETTVCICAGMEQSGKQLVDSIMCDAIPINARSKRQATGATIGTSRSYADNSSAVIAEAFTRLSPMLDCNSFCAELNNGPSHRRRLVSSINKSNNKKYVGSNALSNFTKDILAEIDAKDAIERRQQQQQQQQQDEGHTKTRREKQTPPVCWAGKKESHSFSFAYLFFDDNESDEDDSDAAMLY
mmetsp:Transcript_13439/g.38392  ORF Transcript_13439/g.38392 Transcript_13439/m.38392 type:complete len:185 (+) Transcript_13439:102-656(+)